MCLRKNRNESHSLLSLKRVYINNIGGIINTKKDNLLDKCQRGMCPRKKESINL